jgi:outer membrane protein assembly factor BamB
MRSRKVRPLPARIASMVLRLQLALGLLLGASSVDARSPTPLFDFRPAGYTRAGSLAIAGRSLVVGGLPEGDRVLVSVFDLTSGKPTAVVTTDPGSGNPFGEVVSAGDDTIAVIARRVATVYLFDRSGNLTLSLQTDLVAADEGGFGAGVAVGAGRVAVGAAPAGILLFDAATGALLRVIRVPWSGSAIPLTLSSDTLFVGVPGYESIGTGHEIGHVYAFDTGTGALRWRRHDPGHQSTFGQSLAGDGPDLVVGTWRDPRGRESVGLLDAATGALRRVYRSPRARSGFGSAVAIRGDRILIGAPDVEDGDGRAYLFSRASGARLRTYRVGSRGDGGGAGRSVALAAGVAVVGAPGSGHVLVFRAPVR